MSKSKEFVWTDDEIQLLIESAADFEAQQEYAGVCCESIRSKYESIRQLLVDRYPGEGKDEEIDERYPRKGENIGEITKDRVCSKLKVIRKKYKKAVDSRYCQTNWWR